MKTRVVAVNPDQPDPALIDEAAAIIRSGGLVAFGTETVYGLGADATNPEAVARIFVAKGRPPTNPLIVHVADVTGAITCVEHWPEAAAILATQFWPGPLTIVLPRSNWIPDIVTAGQAAVGVRVPGSVVSRELIRRACVPIAAPSANRSNRTSPTTAGHVFKDLNGRVDLILDSGPCAVGIESTVLSLSGKIPTILRPGQITAAAIAATLRTPTTHFAVSISLDQAAASPGQLAVHYAPRTPAYRLNWSDFRSWHPQETSPFSVVALGAVPEGFELSGWSVAVNLANPAAAAAGLYGWLHQLDELKLDFILIVTPADDEPGWRAVLDRVRRATLPWVRTATETPDARV